jgi:hypothetical protein
LTFDDRIELHRVEGLGLQTLVCSFCFQKIGVQFLWWIFRDVRLCVKLRAEVEIRS